MKSVRVTVTCCANNQQFGTNRAAPRTKESLKEDSLPVSENNTINQGHTMTIRAVRKEGQPCGSLMHSNR